MPGNNKSYKHEQFYTNTKAIKNGIKTYKAHRFLWDPTHRKYYCQKWRVAAWEEVTNVWCEHNKGIPVNYVKNRISCMRSNYSRQRKKVELQWSVHGIRYKPKLWYYDLMSFVGNPFNTNHDDDIDEKEFARNLEEKQKRNYTRPVIAAASKGFERVKPLSPQERYDFTTLLQPELEQESSLLFSSTKLSDNDNYQFHESLPSSYLIKYEEDTDIPKTIFDFTLDKKEYDNIINGLSPNSFE